jgi:hypothetical protein
MAKETCGNCKYYLSGECDAGDIIVRRSDKCHLVGNMFEPKEDSGVDDMDFDGQDCGIE